MVNTLSPSRILRPDLPLALYPGLSSALAHGRNRVHPQLASGADRVSGPGGVLQGGVFGWRAVALALPSGPGPAAVRPNSCRQGLVPATVRCRTGTIGTALGAVAPHVGSPCGCDSGGAGPFVVPGHCGRRPASVLPGTGGRSVGHPFRVGPDGVCQGMGVAGRGSAGHPLEPPVQVGQVPGNRSSGSCRSGSAWIDLNGSIGCCPRQECKVDCPTTPSCLLPLKVGRRGTGNSCPFDSIVCRGHNLVTRPIIDMAAKPGVRHKRGSQPVGGSAPRAEDCGVQVHQSGCQPVGTRIGIVGPRPTWWLNGPTGAFDPRCCRTTCAMLRAARFRKTTRIRHPSVPDRG